MHFRMDWRAINFDWNHARAFLATAEEGSLTAAAKALGLTQPTLGRQISALEQELGVALFDRVARGLALTPSGLELVEHVRAMREAANAVSLTASGQAQAIEGTIRITATDIYAAYVLPPMVMRLRELAPGVIVEIIATNTVSDLRRREADIAIRSAAPTDPTLIARKVRDDEAFLYATPAYLNSIGRPEIAAGFSKASFIGFENNEPYIKGLNEFGFSLTSENFPILTASHHVHWQLTIGGAGIGVMPRDVGDKEPNVERVLPDLAPFPVPIWLVAHRELNTSRRVRLVFDFLADELSAH